MINLKYIELHSPLFLAGTNLGQKLPRHRSGITIKYDRPNQEVFITYNGETAIIPTTNVVAMIEGEIKDETSVRTAHIPSAEKITAQVSTPQSHVFAGVGHGKTGKDK